MSETAQARRRWRVADCLLVLRQEVDAAAPSRSKASDGTIGDAAHASRSSDHNPWVVDDKGTGVVRALDVTHDPDAGMNAHELAEKIRLMARAGDLRIRYIISNGRIASSKQNWAWRNYTGSNQHTKHCHISASTAQRHYDSVQPWGVSTTPLPTPGGSEDMIQYNTKGAEVRRLQIILNRAAEDQGGWLSSTGGKPLEVDGHAGPLVFSATVEMLNRGIRADFANRAAVDLVSDLGKDPESALRTQGIDPTIVSAIFAFASAR